MSMAKMAQHDERDMERWVMNARRELDAKFARFALSPLIYPGTPIDSPYMRGISKKQEDFTINIKKKKFWFNFKN